MGKPVPVTVRVETKFILQGIIDRTDTEIYGASLQGDDTSSTNTKLAHLKGAWWENDSETIMHVYDIYGTPGEVECVTEGEGPSEVLLCRAKSTGEVLVKLPLYYNREV
jgi:hypothetical protein